MIFLQLSQQLQSLSNLLLNLTDEQFTKKIVHLGNSSIGGHTRHVIELLQCATDGYCTGEVDYVNRKRNLLLENDKMFAQSALEQRELLFQNWIAMKPPVSKLSLLCFFKSYDDTENGFILNRNEVVKTLSFSFITITKNTNAVISYYDFSNYSYSVAKIDLQSEPEDSSLPGNVRRINLI